MADWLEVRITVDGVEVLRERMPQATGDEQVDTAVGESYADRHFAICAAADDAGKTWLLEITDPDGNEALHHRMSNDPSLLPNPIAATVEVLENELRIREAAIRDETRP